MNMIADLFSRFRKPDSFVLALGGGGGRGMAHLGVLEVLEEHKLRPAAIVGTSIGALFGAMYAYSPDIVRVKEHVYRFIESEKFNQMDVPVMEYAEVEDAEMEDESWLSRFTTLARQSILYTRAATDIAVADVDMLIQVASELCAAKTFSELKIPLYINAVEFPTGECHMFSEGDLPMAIAASMCVPGVFNPVEIDGRRFVDGGLASELPSKEAKMIARQDQVIVAVNVGARPHPGKEPGNVLGMLDWAARIKAFYLRQYKKDFADILVEPLVGFTQWHDFSNPDQEVGRGRDAMLEKMPELLKLLGDKK